VRGRCCPTSRARAYGKDRCLSVAEAKTLLIPLATDPLSEATTNETPDAESDPGPR